MVTTGNEGRFKYLGQNGRSRFLFPFPRINITYERTRKIGVRFNEVGSNF